MCDLKEMVSYFIIYQGCVLTTYCVSLRIFLGSWTLLRFGSVPTCPLLSHTASLPVSLSRLSIAFYNRTPRMRWSLMDILKTLSNSRLFFSLGWKMVFCHLRKNCIAKNNSQILYTFKWVRQVQYYTWHIKHLETSHLIYNQYLDDLQGTYQVQPHLMKAEE